jgi:O-methyltransferase
MINFLLKNPLFSPIRIAGWTVLTRILARRHLAIMALPGNVNSSKAFELIRDVRRQTSMVLLDAEAYNIYAFAQTTGKVAGAIAELGVYRGGSARLICQVKGDRSLHLFDTFAGLPEASKSDPDFRKGGFASSETEVRQYLSAFPDVHFHVGFFPDTTKGLEDLKFSFVHLDADLYESTIAGLQWFYPRLNRGGMLVSHDYDAEGVRRAFDEFFADKPEYVLDLGGTQAAFVKL